MVGRVLGGTLKGSEFPMASHQDQLLPGERDSRIRTA